MKQSLDIKDSYTAIIGMGCMFPKSQNLEEYWHLLFNGIDAIQEIPDDTHWNLKDYFDSNPDTPDHIYCKRGGFLPKINFDPLSFGIPPNNLSSIDTSQLFALIASKMALEDAGYPLGHSFLKNKRVNVILGVTGTQELVIPLGARLGHPVWKKALKDSKIDERKSKEIIQRIQNQYVEWQENSFPGLLGNVIAGRIANRFNLSGTNSASDAACASSLSAIHNAVMELHNKRCDMSITGGVDTLNDIFMHMCFAKTKVLSFTHDAKPFSKNADGTVLGEGAGILILKRLEDAKKDNDKIYAIIKGIGTSSDGRTSAIYAPDVKGQLKALKQAYEQASIEPCQTELIEAHGTGTKVGDQVEFDALKQCFNNSLHKNKTALGSVKSMIGHTKAAAGAAGIIKSTLALYHKVIPPTLKALEPDPALDINNSPFYLNSESKPWLKNKLNKKTTNANRKSGVSAFGFGGSNFHIVLEEYSSSKNHVSWDGFIQIIAFSSDAKEKLIQKIKKFQSSLNDLNTDTQSQSVAWLSYNLRQEFKANQNLRLLIVHKKTDDIHDNLNNALKLLEPSFLSSNTQYNQSNSQSKTELKSNSNIYFSSQKKHGKLGILCAGQASQYINMGKDIISVFPEALDSLQKASDVFDRVNHTPDKEEYFKPLHEYIFAPPLHLQNKKESIKQLCKTNIAQPAIGAVTLAMLKVLKRFGIKPDMVCGHSFGELSALYCAGWIDENDFLLLATKRGKYMAEQKNTLDRGSMLAVKANLNDIQDMIKKHKLDLVLANKNTETQGVLSGLTKEIIKAKQICQKQNIPAVLLEVSRAFHSPMMKNAAFSFKKYLSKIKFNFTDIEVLSNFTSDKHKKNLSKTINNLGEQLTNPVDFLGNIKNMHDNGIDTFLEVGPKSILTKLVKSILNTKNIDAFALDAQTKDKSGIENLAHILSMLAAKGFDIDIKQWENKAIKHEKQKMTIRLCGANLKPEQKKKEILNQIKIKKNENQRELENLNESKNLKESKKENMETPLNKKESDNDKNERTNLSELKAMQMVKTSLETMKELQAHTARAHEKFLETQSLTSKALSDMVQQTTNLYFGNNEVFSQPIASSKKKENLMPESSYSKQAESKTVSSHNNDTISEKNLEQNPMTEPLKPLAKKEDETESKTFNNISLNKDMPSSKKPDDIALKTSKKEQDTDLDNNSKITNILIDIISEATGFPKEMLEPSMDIESDLGIDSIKRVEILSKLEQQLDKTIFSENIAELKTIEQITGFLSNQKSDVDTKEKQSFNIANDLESNELKKTDKNFIEQEKKKNLSDENKVLNKDLTIFDKNLAFAEKSYEKIDTKLIRKIISLEKYPIDDIKFHNGAQIKLPKNKKVYITKDSSNIAELLRKGFQKEKINSELIDIEKGKIPNLPDAAGIVIVPDVFNEKENFEKPLAFLQSAFLLIQKNAGYLVKSNKEQGAFLSCITFLGGDFGFNRIKTNPIYTGIVGLIKTAGLEYKNLLCKSLDMPEDKKTCEKIAKDAAILMMIKGSSEIGVNSKECNIPVMIETNLSSLSQTLNQEAHPYLNSENKNLDKNDVIIITGGAKGVTSACAIEIAKQYSPIIILIGKSKLFDSEPEWAKGIDDSSELKKIIMENLSDSLKGTKEKLIAFKSIYKRIISHREITNTLKSIEQYGSKVKYFSADVQDNKKINEIFKKIRKEFNCISAIIHGAGINRDKLIVDKDIKEFNQVINTKVKGFYSLLGATKNDELKYFILFSSIAAKYGNIGQCDYSVANEILNKIALKYSRQNIKCKFLSINWGPWQGGMVNNSLKKEFLKKGFGLISLKQGAKQLLNELKNNDYPEVIIEAKPLKVNKVLFLRESILAFAQGKPSDAFGKKYEIFNEKRQIARLPRPPYFFMDRVIKADHPQWINKPGGWIETEYDINGDEWYFKANKSSFMPFCVLLEIALQPCGWLAAYAGSAFESNERLYFRNLGGKATLYEAIPKSSSTLIIKCKMTNVSKAGGMVIQDYKMQVYNNDTLVYNGVNNFGFFTSYALANQVGMKNNEFANYKLSKQELGKSKTYSFKDEAPITPDDTAYDENKKMPSKALRMIDEIQILSLNKGLYGNGYIKAIKNVDPKEWFFDAHFYQDPVCPGSLGIESFLQTIRFFIIEKFKINFDEYEARLTSNQTHEWQYRGQIIPTNKKIQIHTHIKTIDESDGNYAIIADAALVVDNVCIYEMKDFGLEFTKARQKSKIGKETTSTFKTTF